MEEVKKDEVTTKDIMDFLVDNMATKGDLDEATAKLGTELRGEMRSMEVRIKDELRGEMRSMGDNIKRELRVEMRQIEQNTRDYIADKVTDLKGDLTVLMRKEDTKVVQLIGILKKKKVLDAEDERMLLSMEPFAKLYI